jgi:hypothetical protein
MRTLLLAWPAVAHTTSCHSAVYGALVEDLNDALKSRANDSGAVGLDAWLNTLAEFNDDIQLSSTAAEAYYSIFVTNEVCQIKKRSHTPQ